MLCIVCRLATEPHVASSFHDKWKQANLQGLSLHIVPASAAKSILVPTGA